MRKRERERDQARKRHININFLVRLLLGRPWECPGDQPGLSLGQTHFVPGTNPGFLLVFHNENPVCARDKPSLSLGQTQGRRAAEKEYVLNVYVPFSLAKIKNEKSAQRGTDIPRTSGGHSSGYPGPKLRSGHSKCWKNKHLGADLHAPKVRTSTTPRDFQNPRSEKLWAEFSFPNKESETPVCS